MRRLAALPLLAVVAAFALFGTGAKDSDNGNPKFKVELDNAFGMIEGADVKVAGVRAGKITTLDLDRTDMRAVVGIELTQKGFGDLRTDVFCETRPQSLIGEYFLDCKPGTKPERLKPGSTIPVGRTATTIPPDLVNNIMRRPYRERLSIIYNELGGALAARGEDLNETIRRASPALREVDRVLAILKDQRFVIRDLYRDADRVLGALATNKRDVTRFVREARDTAKVSAERTQFVRRNFQLLPPFLRELQPTMDLLGQSAVAQEGALRNLNTHRHLLKRFVDALGPFAEASRPAIRTLGEAAEVGRPAVKATLPRIRELGKAIKPLPEGAQNLAITLEHLDDPAFAVEKDPRSPRNGAGYTGLEALLRYVFAQTQAINLFDANSYFLKVSLFLDNNCAPYADAARAKDPARKYCRAVLGPNQPGIDQPDPTAGATTRAKTRKKSAKKKQAEERPASTPEQAPAETPTASEPSKPSEKPSKPTDVLPVPLPPEVQEILDEILPKIGGATDDAEDDAQGLLDFLLAP